MQNIFVTAMKRFQLCLIDTHVFSLKKAYWMFFFRLKTITFYRNSILNIFVIAKTFYQLCFNLSCILVFWDLYYCNFWNYLPNKLRVLVICFHIRVIIIIIISAGMSWYPYCNKYVKAHLQLTYYNIVDTYVHVFLL